MKPDGLVLLVAGGREISPADDRALRACLDGINREAGVALVIHGNARGADNTADEWACALGIHTARVRALWHVEPRRAAGPRRNAAMARLAPAIDLAVIAPGGRGTADMTEKCRRLGVPVWLVADPTTWGDA